MAVTLTILENTILDILREPWFSSAYPQTLIDLMINSAQQDIISGRVIHPFTGDEAKAGSLHFLNTDVYYSNVPPTYLSADTTVGAVVIYADTTNFPSSGSLYLWGQTVDYTAITATSFTGVTPLSLVIKAGIQVSIAFKIPTDFWDTIEVIYNNKIKLPQKSYDLMFAELNGLKWTLQQRSTNPSIYEWPYQTKPFYTIKDTSYLIVYQLNDLGWSVHFRYKKIAPAITSIQESIIDNDIYAQLCISELAVANILFHRWEEVRAGQLFNLAIADIRKLYSWYDDVEFEDQSGQVYKSAHWGVNI